MYVDVADSATLPYGWTRYARFSLAVVNQIHSKFTVKKEISTRTKGKVKKTQLVDSTVNTRCINIHDNHAWSCGQLSDSQLECEGSFYYSPGKVNSEEPRDYNQSYQLRRNKDDGDSETKVTIYDFFVKTHNIDLRYFAKLWLLSMWENQSILLTPQLSYVL